MTDWRKTKCCGTCALFDVDKAKNKAGRVHRDSGVKCAWVSTEVYPISVYTHWNERPSPSWVRRDDGKNCPCYIKREAA